MDVHPPSPSVATTLKGSELPSAMWSPTCPTKIGDAVKAQGSDPTQYSGRGPGPGLIAFRAIPQYLLA